LLALSGGPFIADCRFPIQLRRSVTSHVFFIATGRPSRAGGEYPPTAPKPGTLVDQNFLLHPIALGSLDTEIPHGETRPIGIDVEMHARSAIAGQCAGDPGAAVSIP